MVADVAETTGQGLSRRAQGLIPLIVGLGAVVGVFALAFQPSMWWILGEWSGSSGVLSHGYLVAAISIVLFIRAIPEAARAQVQPMWLALLPLLGLSVLWLLGVVATVIAIQSIVLPAILLTALAAAFGKPVAQPFAFPVLFVYFAIPAVEHLQFIFQAITVVTVSVLIRVADIPALVQGNFVHIPQGTFEIAGGCGGLSYVVAGLSLAILYAHLYYTRISQMIRLAALVLAVTMVGNWIRVFAVIVIGYRSDMQSPLVADHLTLGWIMFSVLMIPVYFLARRWEDEPQAAAANPAAAGSATASGQRVNWFAIVAATLAMAAGPLWAHSMAAAKRSVADIHIEFPRGNAHWSGPLESHWGWQPVFAGHAAEAQAEYRSGEDVVLAYANVYLTQAQDRELIYFSNNVYGDWRELTATGDFSATVNLDDGSSYGQSMASNYVGDWLIWYRYQNGSAFDTLDADAKISQAIETLRGNPEAGIVAFATPCRLQCVAAADRLAAFVEQIGHSINLDIVQEQQ